MNRPGAFVLDFDGTITTRDMSDVLLDEFAGPGWRELYPEGGDPRHWLTGSARLLPGNPDSLLEYVLAHVEVRPGFGEFVEWCKRYGIPVAVASDGFGFYIEPVLRKASVQGLVVYRNDLSFEGVPAAFIPHAHGECETCGNCKARVVRKLRRQHGSVGYVGDGSNDRFGSSHADVVFARDRLANVYQAQEIPYIPWNDFFDVVAALSNGIAYRQPRSMCPPGTRW